MLTIRMKNTDVRIFKKGGEIVHFQSENSGLELDTTTTLLPLLRSRPGGVCRKTARLVQTVEQNNLN